MEWNKHYPAIFSSLESVQLQFCNSADKTLVRAADIVANHIYYKAVNELGFEDENLLHIAFHP